VPDLEIGVDAILQPREAQLLEPADVRRGEVVVLELRERRAPPEGERLAEEPRPLGRRRRPRALDEALEPAQAPARLTAALR
jgi:hypothetical protein